LLSDLCYTAAVRRTHHEYRLAVVGANKADMVKQLEAFCQGESMPTLHAGQCVSDMAHKMVFVFPGHGSQWIGMGRQLIEQEALFRTTLENLGHGHPSLLPFIPTRVQQNEALP
jgi:acyl transferase domain-containing protein